jgi:hypothetical protein
MKSGRYSLVPILPPDVKHNSRGRPRTGSQKAPAVSKNGRWKSNHEVEETKRKKKQKAKRRRIERAELTQLEKELVSEDEEICDAETENQSTGPIASTSQSNITKMAKRVYKCSKCATPGHRANNCPAPASVEDTKSQEQMDNQDFLPPPPLIAEEENLLPPIAEEEDDSDTHSNSDIDKDKDLCPFCDDEMPSNPSTELITLKAELMAMPNIRQGMFRPGSRLLPVSRIFLHFYTSS